MTLVNLLFYPAVVLVTTVTASIVMYLAAPSVLFMLYMRIMFMIAGMKIKYAKGPETIFCYGEKNSLRKDRSSIVLLHGFTSNKYMWTAVIKRLPKDLHVIAVDLPGHGGSTVTKDESLNFDGQIVRVKEFLDVIGMGESAFHLIGTSMGGTLAVAFAGQYPEMIAQITVICPAMQTPVENWFAREVFAARASETVDASNCSLIPQNVQEMQKMLHMCMYHEIKLSESVLKAILTIRKPYTEFFLKLFKALLNDKCINLVEDEMHRVISPAQVIWGENDQIIDSSGVDVLRGGLPDLRQVTIIPRCGHSITIDRPGAVTKALLQFRGELSDKRAD